MSMSKRKREATVCITEKCLASHYKETNHQRLRGYEGLEVNKRRGASSGQAREEFGIEKLLVRLKSRRLWLWTKWPFGI